jgi:uncharacterized protein (DUF2384 family)
MSRESQTQYQPSVPVIVGNSVGRAITSKSVAEHARDTFGTKEKAAHWMNRPNALFGGKAPIQVIKVDPISVEAELVRIDYGVYA